VVNVYSDAFTCWIVPYTLKHTTIASFKSGTRVNLEVDVLARYVIRGLEMGIKPELSGGITEEFLREHGFG
jgi:riboflavin synthase